MTLTGRNLARCEDCNKDYRVPDPDRTYTCKACGGTVRVAAEPKEPSGEPQGEPHDHLEGAVTCPKCQAVNLHGAHFCDECGAVLEASAPLHTEESALMDRREASRLLRRGYKWIGGITVLYRLGAIAYASVTLVAILALASLKVPLGAGILVIALSTILTVLMLMGSIQILFKPFVWTVIIASVATLVSVAHLIGPNPLGLAFAFSAFWAAVSWAAVVPTMRQNRLIEQHKDLYIIHHASQRTRRSLEGHSARDRHERLQRVMRRANERAWKISTTASAVICVLSAVGAYSVYASIRPQTLAAALEEFETEWNGRDVPAVGEMFLSRVRQSGLTRLANMVDGHGWKRSLPRLGDGRKREGDEEIWVDYELDDFTLSTRWFLEDRNWFLVELELPVPPFAPTFQRFLQAWRSSDAKAIAGFFPADDQARMLESIERSVAKRGWNSFPAILEKNMSENSTGEATATLTLRGGEVSTKWLFRNRGVWGLNRLQFPRL